MVVDPAGSAGVARPQHDPEPGRAAILYFHGNGGSLADRRDRARLPTQDGRGLLIVSYRGYSGSTGTPSEAGLRLDARAARDWLGSYAPDRIVLYGESLGTGVSVRLATEREVGGLGTGRVEHVGVGHILGIAVAGGEGEDDR